MLEPTVECRAVKATVTALIDDLLKMQSYIGLGDHASYIFNVAIKKFVSFILLLFDGLQFLDEDKKGMRFFVCLQGYVSKVHVSVLA